MSTPVEITVGTKNAGTKNVDHQYFIVPAKERYTALRAVLGMNPYIFGCVFCRTKIETQKVAEKLIQDGHKAAAIHGDLSQNQRDSVMQSFRKKKIQLLIATDVAARGIDVEDITHVINYQLPDEIETYTHRSGRTGRAGKDGSALTFLTSNDRNMWRSIQKLIDPDFKVKEEAYVGPYRSIVNNLFDEAYYDFAISSVFHDDAHYGTRNVYPLPGRNFFVNLGYTF